jgi:hypothetical protein
MVRPFDGLDSVEARLGRANGFGFSRSAGALLRFISCCDAPESASQSRRAEIGTESSLALNLRNLRTDTLCLDYAYLRSFADSTPLLA